VLAGSASASAAGGDGDDDLDDEGSAARTAPVLTATPAAPSPPPLGAYVVRPGDTLWSIAQRAGRSVANVAGVNGLDPSRPLLPGTVLKLPEWTPPQSAMPAPRFVPWAAPYPTAERVTGAQIAQIAAAGGVPPSLAKAVGWQESGWNNALVSSANARGVMQIIPGTWDWIQRTLTGGAPLSPASALDNVRGGVLYLHSLLAASGGDPAMAAAGYYQGLQSVRQQGMFPDTRRYVSSVLALQRRFGGP
jgi:soluble lytic murein transglycosylase-like protein